jgi:hypothetical protein
LSTSAWLTAPAASLLSHRKSALGTDRLPQVYDRRLLVVHQNDSFLGAFDSSAF